MEPVPAAKRARKSLSPPPIVLDYTPDEFAHLRDHGYMVIPDVLTADECAHAKRGLHQWFAGLGTGLSAEDATTWTPKARPFHLRGIIQNLGVAHLQPVWDVRQNPRVVDVFRRLWSVERNEDMLSSFDGICVNPPLRSAPKSRKFDFVEGQWYHVDQGRRRGSACRSIQGFVTLNNITAKDQTLSVLPGMHKHHAELLQRHAGDDSDWVLFDEPLLRWAWETAGRREVHVEAPAGSMVLFDSRTPHCNTPRASQAWRHVIYTCYAPRRFATEAQLKKKREAFENRARRQECVRGRCLRRATARRSVQHRGGDGDENDGVPEGAEERAERRWGARRPPSRMTPVFTFLSAATRVEMAHWGQQAEVSLLAARTAGLRINDPRTHHCCINVE
jgi:hypothetical protein